MRARRGAAGSPRVDGGTLAPGTPASGCATFTPAVLDGLFALA